MKIKREIYVDPSWTYKTASLHLKALKSHYDSVLASFSLTEAKEWASFIRSTRDQFYALNLLEWQKDNLWNYMNGNYPYSYLIRSASRYK